MRRIGKLFTVIGLVVVLLLAAATILLATADWNRLRPILNERASAALGRPFAINGELSVDWRRDARAAGWRRVVPWMDISAADLRIGNPAWAASPAFATFERVKLRLALLPLLRREVAIARVDVTQPAVWLERRADGHANWVFDQDEEPEAQRWTLDIGEIAFDRGQVALADAISAAEVALTIDPLAQAIPFRELIGRGAAAPAANDEATPQAADGEAAAPDYAFGWQAKGRYRGQPFTGSGKTGGLLALHDAARPFPLQADVHVGNTHATVVGTLTDPRALAALDLQLSLRGANLADLFPLTGVALPDSGAYATSGRLSAELQRPGGAVFHYRDFSGRVGDSDIRGNLSFTAAAPRARLEGEISSRLLRFADLAPLVGADYDAPRARRAEQPPERVLPVEPFRTDRWRAMDANVRFTGQRLDRGEQLPFTDMQTHLLLNDGELRLDPLRFGIAGGRLEGLVRVDGRAAPMRGHARLKARRLTLKALFAGFEAMQTSLGELNGEIDLRGRGNSVAALLGSADGEIRLILNDGAISRGLMEIAGLNVGSYLVTKLFGDDEVQINCVVADLGVADGLMRPRVFLFDTENARIDVEGAASLADEQLDLVVRPQSKGGMRILSLRSPLYVRGSFKAPDAGVQTGPLIARGAGAVALGAVVAPVAALLALIAPSVEADNPCVALLEEMRAERR